MPRGLKLFCGLGFAFLSIFDAACAKRDPVPKDIDNNVIAVNSDGVAVDPSRPNRDRPLDMSLDGQFATQLKAMFKSMDDFHDAQQLFDPDSRRKILIFVHGGLNEPKGTVQAAVRDRRRIMDANVAYGHGYYPIFINWDSGLISSYGEHLVSVTQGQKETGTGGFYRMLLSPFHLFADVGRAVTRAPLVWIGQVSDDVTVGRADLAALAQGDPERHWLDNDLQHELVSGYAELRRLYKEDAAKNMAVSLGAAELRAARLAWRGTTYVLTSPTKFLLSPVIDGAGKASWDNMSRRTLILFEGPRWQRAATQPSIDDLPTGAVEVFMRRLKDHLRLGSHPATAPAEKGTQRAERAMASTSRPDVYDPQYEITLIGHSMGAMVLNELLRRHADYPYFRNIVYMGAACSVREFQKSVIPYLQRHRPELELLKGRAPMFYNLCLHPVVEMRSIEYFDIPPRGTLLVWIDNFLADPATELDRTLGRFSNILRAADVVPPDVRPRVTIKGFGMVERKSPDDNPWRNPQMHGDFRGQDYWDPEFWKPIPPKDDDPLLKKAQQRAMELEKQKSSPRK